MCHCESISLHDEKSIPQLTEVAINRVSCYVCLTVILKKIPESAMIHKTSECHEKPSTISQVILMINRPTDTRQTDI